jgi:P-type E1-E2 ATPase
MRPSASVAPLAENMIELTIPGRGTLRLQFLVCDVNGTLALDGRLIEGVARPLLALQDRLELHLLTADTHGKQAEIDRQLAVRAERVPPGDEAGAKAVFVRKLGAEHVVAIGNGANDAGMLIEAAVGIAVISPEGTAAEALQAADIVAPDIAHALELLERPMRLVASLRR